ncbi:MAG: hypothetical protein R3A10_03750 [Caldilineaceae bacterium]
MDKATILIPLDSSPLSRTILPYVRRIFDPDSYVLFFLKVITLHQGVRRDRHSAQPYLCGVDAPQMYEAVEQWRSEKHDSIERKQGRASPRAVEGSCTRPAPLVGAGYKVRVLAVIRAEPLASIEGRAPSDEPIFAVAMTTTREGFDRLLHGSIAGKLLQNYDMPLLLYHPSQELHGSPD